MNVRNSLLAILAFVSLGSLAVFWGRSYHNSSLKVVPIEDNSWREKVKYEPVTKLSELQRRDIYQQVIHQMTMTSFPDTAYHIIARKNRISVKDIKNIIGEGIASNWKVPEDSIGRKGSGTFDRQEL
jgi:hypothetical protein